MSTTTKYRRTEITPPKKNAKIDIKELIDYKDLIFLFVKRDFVSKYKQTVLGPAWAIIQPLLTTVVFTIIFGNLANLPTFDVNNMGGVVIPSFLFYMTGNICWSYFSAVVNGTSNTFLANAHIMGKVYFPRMVAPISTTISNLISFFIQMAMFVIIWFVYIIQGDCGIQLSKYALLIPLLILQMMILSMGVGIIVSSLTTKYRDLAMLVGFGLQLWQYACPIAYGLQLIPDKYMFLYMLNPVTPVITTFRYAVFGIGYFDLVSYLIGWGTTLVVLYIGLKSFNKIEKTFMDTI